MPGVDELDDFGFCEHCGEELEEGDEDDCPNCGELLGVMHG